MYKPNYPLQTLSEDQHNLLNIIQSEYKAGMLALNNLGPQTFTFYGGARIQPTDPSFTFVHDLAKSLAQEGWGVVSGGGPGIMAAALEGAQAGSGKAIAFCIDIPGEPPALKNPDVSLVFTQFAARKFMLRQSDAFAFAPGGLGTLDEMMELLTLIKTGKYPAKPIFLLESAFWSGYLDWFKEILLNERKTVSEDFLTIFELVDSPQEVMDKLYPHKI